MDILFWRKNKKIDEFAIALADGFYSSLPPNMIEIYYGLGVNNKQEKKITKKIETIIKQAVSEIKEFKTQHSLGTYGKARLHMQFRDRLVELGYDSEIGLRLNEVIMLKTP